MPKMNMHYDEKNSFDIWKFMTDIMIEKRTRQHTHCFQPTIFIAPMTETLLL